MCAGACRAARGGHVACRCGCQGEQRQRRIQAGFHRGVDRSDGRFQRGLDAQTGDEVGVDAVTGGGQVATAVDDESQRIGQGQACLGQCAADDDQPGDRSADAGGVGRPPFVDLAFGG